MRIQSSSVPRGLFSLFSGEELKRIFQNYLASMAVVEAVILAVSYASKIASRSATFPWKPYFLAAFLVPLGITFLGILFVMSFNLCLRGGDEAGERGGAFPELVGRRRKGFLDRLEIFFHVARQIPFLLGLVVLAVFSGLVYQSDAIFSFLARAGEQAARYLFVAGVVTLALAAVLGGVWLYLDYRLRRRRIDHQYRYRLHVAEQMKLVILDNNEVVDETGKLVWPGGDRKLPGARRSTEPPALLSESSDEGEARRDAATAP